MTLDERATLLQQNLVEDGIHITHDDARDLLIADFVFQIMQTSSTSSA